MIRNNVEKIKKIIYLSPIVFIGAIVPLVVFYKVIILEGEWFEYWSGVYSHNDFFTYSKSVLIISLTIINIILIVLRSKYDNFHFKKSKIYMLLLVYLILVFISAFMSEFKYISMFGFINRHEGLIVLLSYIIIFTTIFYYVNEDFDIKLLLLSMFCSACIISTIGVLQYFGIDFYESSIGIRLIYPTHYQTITDSEIFLQTKNLIYATFGNSNYVGSYMAMIFPISFGLYFFQKRPIKVFAYGLSTLLFYMMWIGCKSRAGVLGGLIAIVVFILIYRKELFKNIKKFWILVPFIIIFLLMNWFSSGSLINKINTLNPMIEKELADLRNIDLEDIVINKNDASIIGKEYILNMSFINDKIIFTDEVGLNLELKINDDGVMIFNDIRYSNFAVRYKIFPSKTLLEMRLNNRPLNWYFENGELSIIGKLGTFYTELNKPESFGFEGRERFASSRGYIWSRSIPLLKDALLIGYGPDTFAAVFPQDDLIGKIKYLSRTDILVDKPHNFYLQTFLNTGGLSLISLLVIFIVYIWNGFKLFWNSDIDAYHKQIGLVILIAIIGYLVAAFFNDSVVSVAPVFWTLLGVGYSINDRIKNENNIQEIIEDSTLNE